MVVMLFKTLPRLPTLWSTPYSAPGGSTIVVGDGGNFQTALDGASRGDIITLNAGSTYAPVTLPDKGAGTGWIYIRSSAALTTEGTRITTGQAAGFPKIATSTTGAAIQAAAASSYYRFINCDIKSGSTAVNGYLVGLGSGSETDAADFPHHIILDRCAVRGDPTNGGRRGVMFAGSYQAVIDSYLSDWKEVGADNQAVGCWTGTGPYKLVNNYLEASGENILFGGAGTGGLRLSPSDIEIRGNHFFKPLTWKIGDPSYLGVNWTVKNTLELKHAVRVLITENVFENCWAESQAGYAIVFTGRNQTGSTPWATVTDVTYKNNILKNSAAGVDVLGADNDNPNPVSRRILIEDNLHYDIYDSTGAQFLILRGERDLIINHNTVIGAGNVIVCSGGAPNLRFKYTNNIALHNQYGIIGDGTGSGNGTIAQYFPGSEFLKNVIVMNTGDLSGQYPANNYYPTDVATVDFENYAGDDYRLKSTSPYIAAATDGGQIGTRYFG